MKTFAIRSAGMLTAVALMLLTAGCIEFERQVMSYRYDQKADTLLIFQDYQGIYGADNSSKLTDIEVEQIQSVLKGGRTFFFANWIFEINLPALRDAIADLPDKSGETVAEDELNRVALEVAKLFQANCSIENGDLYRDGEGRLCGVQRIRITNVTKLIPRVSELLKAYYKVEAGKALDDVELQHALNLVNFPDWGFIRLDGNRIQFRFPMSAAEFQSTFKKTAEQVAYFNKVRAAGIDLQHAGGILMTTLGRKDDRVTTIALSPFTKSYRDNLRKHLPGKVKILNSFDAENAAREFLEVRSK